jgi:acyl transferase domain-containing protein
MRQAAIVGMAALFPAAATLDAYWSNLVGAVDAITDVPENRWDAEFYVRRRRLVRAAEVRHDAVLGC